SLACLTCSAAHSCVPPRRSPDGTKLILPGWPDLLHTRFGLWTVDADGSTLTEIISCPPNPDFTAWGTYPQSFHVWPCSYLDPCLNTSLWRQIPLRLFAS